MRCTLLVALSLQLACATLAAQAATAQAMRPVRADAAQDTARPTLRLGYTRVPSPFPVILPSAPLLPAVSRAGFAVERSMATWSARLRAPPWPPPLPRLGAVPLTGPAPRSALAAGVRPPLAVAPDTNRAAAMRRAPVDSNVVNLLPGTMQDFADIGMRVRGRGDLGGAWIQYRPCEPGLRLNCNPGLFPRLQPDMQFGVQVGGTISDRVHIDVDWDQRREFDATNNINVYYQGLKGEALQRVEVGDVSIRLPQSRYLTRGIPAGNFGFKATGRVGGMDVEAVWAQQKGDVATRQFQLDAGAGQAGLVQDASLVLDDADYVRGQFFFVVDPGTLTGAPYIDALTLRAADAPVTVRPHPGALAVYRDEGTVVGNFQQQAQPGYFLADAENGGLSHSGLFRLLQPGVDYVVHPSGLWIMLRVPLRPDEALAVSYVTESGDTVGTPGAERLPPGQTPSLFLVRGPETSNQPNAPTWPYEMHQVYRLDTSSGVDLPSVNLTISLGQASAGLTFRQVQGRRVPYLRLFGLDEDPPADRVDASQILRPSDFGQFTGDAFRGTFVLFPTLQPFGQPPPVPSEGLTADQNAALLGQDANTDIYDVLDPVERRSAARFRLNFQYRVRTEGLASTFNLGALGIREGSERITLDGQPLKRGVDYIIDYDLGTVTLLNPQATLGASPQGQIRATWEQKSLFQVAPTTVFGLSSKYNVGSIGEIDFTSMYQSEKTLMTRPQLGTEPGAIMLGGMSSQLDFGAPWLDALLGALPLHSTDSSRIDIHSELATSRPNPNTRGNTYLDDFESTDQLSLSLEQHAWRLGSMPQDATGASTVLPWPLGLLNAAPLVWQDRYLQAGREVGFLQPDQIDRQINVAGAQLAERALYLTVGDPTVTTTEPRWRSIVTSLSTTGLDLSRSEYLEFYAGPVESSGDNVTLIFDIGTVGEDAFYYDPSGNMSGVNDQGNPWGQGVLDEEARLARREIWGPEADARGLWNQDCQADPINPVPLGDRRADCTRKNGRPDTEDLNGNGVLDASDGAYYRYVVPLKQLSNYMIRDQAETGTAFRLYRIPLRGAGATALNGASAATWRFIRDIRLTVVTREPGTASIALARVRITGSRWAKRNVDGVLAGQTSSQDGTGAGTTSFQVGPVSRLTNGPDYASPAGVTDQVPDPTQAIGASAVEYNEKGLRLSYDQLQPDERAEVYFRYPQQPRSFLKYGQLLLWGLAYRGDWGPAGTQYLMVKLGTDANNYYLYRTRLSPALGGGHVSPQDWLPELVVQFDEWYSLRAQAERMLANRDSAAAGPVAVWSQDSAYAVVLEDRARAPNLAAVREISFAVYNGSGTPSTGEVWLDDLRLGGAVHTPALAGRLDMNVNAGGFLTASLQLGSEGGRFQQLNQDASYQRSTDVGLVTTARLGRLAPESWGLEAPVTVSYSRTGADPIFLPGTDVKAVDLPRLRTTQTTQRHVGIALRKTTPSTNPWLGAIVDGLSVRAGYGSVVTDQIASAENVRTFDGGISYDEQPLDVSVDVVPGFVKNFLRWLAPGAVERSDFFSRLANADLRLTPERISLSAAYQHYEDRTYRYDGILTSPVDTEVEPLESPVQGLQNRASVRLHPFASVIANVAYTSARDLLDPMRATPLALQQQALTAASNRVAGMNVGWEQNRTVTTDLSVRPRIADWLRPSLAYSGQFGLQRSPAYLQLLQVGWDTTALLQRTFRSERHTTAGFVLEPGGFSRALLGGDSTGRGLRNTVNAATGRLLPVELTWDDGLASSFDRQLARPGLAYQFGLGSIDAFRIMQGDSAATTIQRAGFQAQSGLRLSADASLDVAYSRRNNTLTDARAGQSNQTQRTWPDVELQWQDIALPSLLQPFILSASVVAGFTLDRQSTIIGLGEAQAEQSIRQSTVPLQLRLRFGNGLSITYSSTLTSGDGSDPTGGTQQSAVTHSLSVGGRFIAPEALRARFPQPIGLSLRYDYASERQCRLPVVYQGIEDCTPYVDALNRRLDVTVDSYVSQLNVGLQLSYNDRRSFVGTRAGNSQFQLSLFGQFDFSAGTFRGGNHP